jgi:MFS transporter, ACS family, hexuronate transporter
MERAEKAPLAETQASWEGSGLQGKRVWLIVGLLFLATVLNYLDRQVLALTAERIMEEFQLTKEDFGKIIAAFRYSYALFQIVGGWIVDSRGPGLILPLAVGLWSLAGMFTGLVRSVSALATMRFMLGIGEAFNWPCALKVTQRLLPPRDRALANGIFNSGAAAGAVMAPIIVTFITVYYGWRWAFVLIGSLGFIWMIAWFALTRPVYARLGGTRLSISQVLRIMRTIVSKRGFWMLGVSAVIINSVYYFMADWIPLYLKTERGFSFAVGNALSVIVYISLEAGNILVGLFVRHLVKRGYTVVTARRIALLVACLMMSSAPIVGIIPSRAMAVFFLMLIALGVAGFLVIYLTMVQDLEPAYVGTTAGLLGGLGNLAYGAVSPLIGRLADLEQSFLTFSLIGILPWLAFAAIFLGFRKQEH